MNFDEPFSKDSRKSIWNFYHLFYLSVAWPVIYLFVTSHLKSFFDVSIDHLRKKERKKKKEGKKEWKAGKTEGRHLHI